MQSNLQIEQLAICQKNTAGVITTSFILRVRSKKCQDIGAKSVLKKFEKYVC